MVNRVTHAMLTSNFLRNLASISERLQHAQNQLATGDAILKPSDAPTNVARILQYKLTLSQITQFKGNIEDGISQVEKVGSTLLDVNDAIQNARELAVDGASDNLNRQDRMAIADSINQILEGVLQDANDNFKGRFMFAGYNTQSLPFHEDRNLRSGYIDNVRYDGTLGDIYRRIGRFSNLPVNFNGADVFLEQTHTYEGEILPIDEPLGFNGTLTINNRDFVITPDLMLKDIRNMINTDSEVEVFADVTANRLILKSTNSSEDITLSDSVDGDLLQNLGLLQLGAYNIGTAPPTLPLVDSTPAIFTGFGAVANLAYDSTNNRLNIRIGPDADPSGAGQAHSIEIPEGTYASVADLVTAIQGEIDDAFGHDVLVVTETAGVISIETVATGNAVTAGNLVIGGSINGLDDTASDFNDLNLINADPAPATFAQVAGVDGNDKIMIDIGTLISLSGTDISPQVIDLRAANTGTMNDLIDEINYQLFQNPYLRGVVEASDYKGRVRIETVERGADIPASELVITEGATGTLTALNIETLAAPAHMDGVVIGPFPAPGVTITAGVNDQLTIDLGPTISSYNMNTAPRTITLTAGNYASINALVDEINLQIRRYDDLYGSLQAVVGGTAPAEYIRIESVDTASRVRAEDMVITGTALAPLGLAASNVIPGAGTSSGEGIHLEPRNIFDTLMNLRDDLIGVGYKDSKLTDLTDTSGNFLGLQDRDTITISTSLKSMDFNIFAFHRLDDLVFALNEFFGTQAEVRLTRDGRLEFENLETAQIVDLSIMAKSPTGQSRDVFNDLFANFPSNVPGGSKIVSEQIIDPTRYLNVSYVELGKIDIEHENILSFESIVGARSNRMSQTRSLFEDNELNITELKSDFEDANVAEVFTRLTQMEMVLESALNVGSRVLTPSLLNFLA